MARIDSTFYLDGGTPCLPARHIHTAHAWQFFQDVAHMAGTGIACHTFDTQLNSEQGVFLSYPYPLDGDMAA